MAIGFESCAVQLEKLLEGGLELDVPIQQVRRKEETAQDVRL